MDIKEVFSKRVTVRSFENRDIPESIIDEILEASLLAPHTDTVHYLIGVVKDREIKEQLAKATHYANWIQNAPVIFICCANISFDIKEQSDEDYGVIGNKKRYGSEIVEYLRNYHNRKQAKTLLSATPPYLPAQHIILSAVSHGLRGCLVDFMDLEKMNNILNIPEEYTVQVLVPIGYPKQKTVNRSIQSKRNVFFNKYK